MNIYCFSGLGADKRAFQYLSLKPHRLIHIDWITPFKNESLVDYALRIKPIPGNDKDPFAIMGLSFGAMIAVEVAKHLPPDKLIIISSIITKNEMPAKYRLAGLLRLHKLIPYRFFKKPNRLTYYFFGAKTTNAKRLLDAILENTDFEFLRWALGAMLDWNNTDVPKCLRIHGSEDHILPINTLDIDCPIRGGGHFMIVQKADELSKIITDELGTS